MTTGDSVDGVSRRSFLKRAVAVGGAVGLSACVEQEGTVDVPRGPEDLSSLPARQHAWNDVLATDDAGNVLNARHHVLALFRLPESGPPTAEMRTTVESAFQSLERAYARGNQGLLFTVGYSRSYFDRYDDSLPESVDLPHPEPLAPFENPEMDDADVLVHLASDLPEVVLRAEQALRGNSRRINGVEVTAGVTDVLQSVDRRTGFVGAGLPAANADVADVSEGAIPEEAPFFMGFKSGFEKNQASEDRVTIEAGPFAGGATEHLSTMSIDLEQWYEQDDRYQRVAKMFCPGHAEAGTVEGVGENLGTSSNMDDCVDPKAAAREYGIAGHSQKMLSVREDDSPIILRRDFDSTDGDRPGLHFLALQETIDDFVRTREAMNGTDVAAETAVGTRTNNGLLQYIAVHHRGNYLVPPRSLRALPPANPGTEASQ
ncbi:MAG: DUF7405 family protein [Halobacteriota archaeon]